MRGSQRNAVRIFVSAAAGHRAARAPSPLAPKLNGRSVRSGLRGKNTGTAGVGAVGQQSESAWAEKRKNAFEHAELPGACHKRTTAWK